ncbi:MAG: ribokinase [Chloroflexota bacterium]
MSPQIVVVGSLNVDLVIQTPRFPEPGETITGRGFRQVFGGKGANQAAAAARLGADTVLVGCVGGDASGARYLENLAGLGLDVSHVRRDDQAATGTAFILVDEGGENAIVLAPGANARLSPRDVERARETIAAAAVLLVQLETPLETVARALEVARQEGTATILNPAPAARLSAELLACVDVLVPNQSEASLLTGLPVSTLADAFRAGEVLREHGAGSVIVTLGDRGALSVDGQGRLHAPAHAVDVVDTTAAGDAFCAALAVARAEGMGREEGLRFANAAGALAVTRFGAQPSLPDRDEVKALLAAGGAEESGGREQ